ncbi:MAG: hotdog domain-containing protein [Holophaga sp.]|nr:hotdog domain-containing protein [Holophaga sp.]
MNVAMITVRENQLAAFRDELERRSARVESFADGWSFLQAARSRTWELVIVDGLSLAFPDLIEKLLEINASINTAVITDLAHQAFHDAGEGLGILCCLPAKPGAAEVEPLLEKLQAVGGLDPVIETAQGHLDALRTKHHPRCVVCWDRHPFGLKVDFRVTGEHTVEGTFGCGKFYEGYENVLHGGIVSTLLDGAMASCILAKGREAYTVDLRVRYRTAVETGVPATIRAEWVSGSGPVHLLHATLEQAGKVRASARAKFFEGKPNQPSQPMPGNAGIRALLSQARKRLV